MNSFVFTTIRNPEWDKKITTGLRRECEALTGITEDFKIHCIYLKSKEAFAGGISVEVHGDILWIDSLWVESNFRRRGFGKMFVHKAHLFATRNKLKEIQLNTYFQEAHQFFLSCGFQDVAVIPHWKYGLDCHLMRKTV